jgi:O-antigen/teichoic acid export membrane protein
MSKQSNTEVPALKPSFTTALIIFGGFFITLLVNIFISRTLSAEDYGDFSVSVSIATLGGIFAMLGANRAAIKIVPRMIRLKQHPLLRGFFFFNTQTIILSSLMVIGIGINIYAFLFWVGDSPIHHPIL